LSYELIDRVYAMASRQISEEEFLRRFRPEEYERRRKLGVYSDATPQPQNVIGLPPPEARYSPSEIRNILVDSGSLREYARGGQRAGYRLERAAQEAAVQSEIARQALLDADVQSLIAGLSQAAGAPVDRNTALLAREYLAMPGGEGLELRDAVQLAAASGAVQGQLPPGLAEKAAQVGEIGRDQGLDVVLKAANQGLIDPSSPIEAQIEALSPEEKAKLALLARVQGQIAQLSAEDTGVAANALGLGRTVGGRRNSFRKEKRSNEEATVLRTPGSVLSQGMEFKPDDILLPFVIAPKNQQVWSTGKAAGPYSDASGPVMQAAQYYNGGKFAPSLRDAQVLYVNPYAELSDGAVSRLGLDLVQNPIEKDVSGGYDQEALNVPVPDVGQERYGLRPQDDPSFGVDSGVSYRNPTFAEAVNALSLRHRTPIGAFTEDMLVGGGRNYSDVLVGQPERQVFALGSKRRPDGRPAPIADYFKQPAEAGAPRVADVRVGSGQKRTPEFYAALDDLIDAVAQEAYGIPGQALGDAGVIQERSTADRYSPAAASPMPGEAQWGALMNLRSTDPVVADYQRRLLTESGFPINTSAANPLLGVVDLMEQLASAPPSDTDVRRGVLGASAAEPIVAPNGRVGVARILEAAKQRAGELRGRTRPTTDNARQTYEKALSDLVKRGVGGNEPRKPEPAPTKAPAVGGYQRRERAVQPVIPGLEQDVRFPANALDPVTRDLARYMASRAPQSGPRDVEPVTQLVPAELYSRFFERAKSGGTPGGERQGELGLNTLQRGTADALYGRANPTPDGYTPSYVDDVARYMETQQKQRALEEKASSRPISAATNTVQESLLNAPASPGTTPTSAADELLRRKMGRLLGR
jgi:hypothetical protein